MGFQSLKVGIGGKKWNKNNHIWSVNQLFLLSLCRSDFQIFKVFSHSLKWQIISKMRKSTSVIYVRRSSRSEWRYPDTWSSTPACPGTRGSATSAPNAFPAGTLFMNNDLLPVQEVLTYFVFVNYSIKLAKLLVHAVMLLAPIFHCLFLVLKWFSLKKLCNFYY